MSRGARDATLSLVLTLALADTGRPGSDLARARTLFDSLRQFTPADADLPLWIITRPVDLEAVTAMTEPYADELDIVVVPEDSLCAQLRSDPDTTHEWPVENKGWLRQQVLKLAAHELVDSDYYLTLDADVIITRALEPTELLPGGRGRLNVETVEDYRRLYTAAVVEEETVTRRHRYRIADRLLGIERTRERQDAWYGETPVVLSSEIVRELTRHLTARHRADWREVLLAGRTWTEYALYFAFAESTGVLERHHALAGCDDVLDYTHSLWWPPHGYRDGRTLATWPVEAAFEVGSDGFAIVAQSYLGYEPEHVRRRLTGLIDGPRVEGSSAYGS